MSILTEINRIKDAVTAIVNAIKGKGVTVPTTAKVDDLASLVSAIPTGTDTSDATATASHILKDKTAYVKGVKVTGNILTYNYDRCPAHTYGSDETTVYVEGEIGQGNPIFVDDGLVNLEIPLTEFGDAKASDVLASKTFTSSSGRKVTGTIQNKTDANVYVDEGQVIVDAGYYPSKVTKEIDSVTQATPSITVSSTGLITAKSVQGEGYVAGGTKQSTKQLTTQAGKQITPSASSQTAVASGVYTTGAVTVKGDVYLKAENIKKDVTIFGVKGTYESSSGTDDSVIGTWVFNDELTPIGLELDEYGFGYANLYFDYEVYHPEAGCCVKMDNIALSEWVEDEYGLRFSVSYYNDNDTPYWFWDDVYAYELWLAEAFKKINILTEPTDETFISWLKANATKEIPTSISDISIEGTWYFNDEITWPEEFFGEIPLKYSVFIPMDVSKTVGMGSLYFSSSSLGYYHGEKGDWGSLEDVYEQGVGWQTDELRTIVIHEEWVDQQLIEWLRANAKKVGKPLVLKGTEQWDIPYWNCAEGSVAIVKSDSIVGKWEWKDTASPLDLSMFDLQSRYYESIEVHGNDEMVSAFDHFTINTRGAESVEILIDGVLLYANDMFDDQYSTFSIYTDAQWFLGEENQYITIEKFKEFIKANCNRLSGGKALYVKEDNDWVYKGEIEW